MKTVFNPDDIFRITEKHRDTHGSLISILEDIQVTYNYLPRQALEIVAKATGHSMVDLYGVATFYQSFSLEPRGEHVVSVCAGTACHVRGAPTILNEFERKLDVKSGKTSKDGKFTLTTVNCLGACALGPVAVVDGSYHRNVTTKAVGEIVHDCQKTVADSQSIRDAGIFKVDVACPVCNRELLTHDHLLDGHPMVHITASFGRKHGWMRMSSMWGDYRVEMEHEIPEHTIVNYFCPKCHAELRSTKLCARCDASMIPLFVRGGGVIQFCSRRGCKEHMLDLGD